MCIPSSPPPHPTATGLSLLFADLLRASPPPQENPCQHPVFFLQETRGQDMAAIIEFVYRGSVNVSQAQLASFIQTAELLQIRGLSRDDDPKQVRRRPDGTGGAGKWPPFGAYCFGCDNRTASMLT